MSDTEENNPARATVAEEEAVLSTSTRIDQTSGIQEELLSTSTRRDRTGEIQEELPSTSTRPSRHSELQTILPVTAAGNIIEIIKETTDYTVNINIRVEHGVIHGQNIQVGDKCKMTQPSTKGSDSSEKFKKLLDEADLQLQAFREHEGAVFIEPPSFKLCQQKLENGRLTIVGASGDGKTTIAMELLLRQNKRRVVIILDRKDWKKVDLSKDQNLIILFDDMLGKIVLDPNKMSYWETQLNKIFDAVRSGMIQVVITCRDTVLSQCLEEMEYFQLFKPENRVHLSGPDSTCNFDTVTK